MSLNIKKIEKRVDKLKVELDQLFRELTKEEKRVDAVRKKNDKKRVKLRAKLNTIPNTAKNKKKRVALLTAIGSLPYYEEARLGSVGDHYEDSVIGAVDTALEALLQMRRKERGKIVGHLANYLQNLKDDEEPVIDEDDPPTEEAPPPEESPADVADQPDPPSDDEE